MVDQQLVAPRIKQVKSFLDVLQPQSTTAWMNGFACLDAVFHPEQQLLLIGVQVDAYPKHAVFAYPTVLEAIFGKGQQNQRGYGNGIVLYGNVIGYLQFFTIAQLLQTQVIFQQLHFFGQWHSVQTSSINQIIQQLSQFQDAVCRLVGVGKGQTVDVVQRVEQKMRVQLPLEQFDFRFCLRLDQFLIELLVAAVVANDVNSYGQGNDGIIANDVLEHFIDRHRKVLLRPQVIDQFLPFDAGVKHKNRHYQSPKQEPQPLIGHQVPGYDKQRQKIGSGH